MTVTKRQHLTCLHHDDQSSTSQGSTSQGASPAHAIPDFATVKRVGTETFERGIQRAASFFRGDRRQKALVIACAYGPVDPCPGSDKSESHKTSTSSEPPVIPDPAASTSPAVRLDLSDPQKRSRLPNGTLKTLQHAHADGHNLRNMLETKFHFHHVEFLSDESEPGTDTWPSRKNIQSAMARLVDDAEPGDNFVFAFIGHGGQVKNKDHTEPDGLDEHIIAVDGKTILDDELNRALVDRLPDGCKLTAIFDCCHSGTMMDLNFEHKRKNTKASDLVAFRVVPPRPPLKRLLRMGARFLRFGLRRPLLQPASSRPSTRTIIALSACRDEENAWEFKKGNSLTDLLVKIINKHGFVTCSLLHAKLTCVVPPLPASSSLCS
ncbi:hypothetical protein EXIGLDRAFT_721202 [Exidia glandulosa HHB12029]|uniref:Peptidase C14 caspase domain-containing protein n=1 Tax=Exidia glandulosa HHB12029 TaxID=1314781 RepID=A0A165FWB0_EXIGL|nr:hypothetical protein EXIGLDRAFT_721202 [Exidia glandulosa HHB12029]